MKMYRIAQEILKIYHITTKSNANNLVDNGYDPHDQRMFFTVQKDLKKWFNKLRSERNNEYPELQLEDIEKFETKTKKQREYKQYIERRKKQSIEWNDPVVVEVIVSRNFFDKYFSDRSDTNFKEIYYGDQPPKKWDAEKGWHAEYTKPILKNGINCSMRIMEDYELV